MYNIEHPMIDDSDILTERYRHEYMELEEKKIYTPKQAVECLINYLFSGREEDKDVVLQSIQLLGKIHAPNADTDYCEDDIELVPFRAVIAKRKEESTYIHNMVKRVINELVGTQEVSKFNLENTLRSLMYHTGTACGLECVTDILKNINVKRG